MENGEYVRIINKDMRKKDLINREKHFIRNSDDFWVDRKGRVFHLDSSDPKQWTVCECVYDRTEYPYVMISYSGTFRKVYMHRLMAEMFISNPNHLPVVMHKNNDKSNFDISNLKWGTQSENIRQAFDEGRKVSPRANTYTYEVYNDNDSIICKGRSSVSDLIGYSEVSLKNMVGNDREIALGPYKGYKIRNLGRKGTVLAAKVIK